jgi:uncharacterized protein YidB (DUF937 family)
MGIFDEVISGIGSKIFGEAGQGNFMEQILGLINSPQTGGLPGLMDQFKTKGLGDLISSWVGTGENQPVSGEQIHQVFGVEKIQEIAQKMGISGTEASQGLASLLPEIIDKLTPEGKIPEGGILEQGLSLLKNKFV